MFASTLGLFSTSLLSSESALITTDGKPPHIVLLIGDDHGYPYFGFMGDKHVLTPAMDTLSAGGVTYTQGYATTPYCRPSLRALITGLHPIQYNLKKNPIVEEKQKTDPEYKSLSKADKTMWRAVQDANALSHFETLPRLLKQKGYVSWQGGKWWENSYKTAGFDEGMTYGWNMSKFGTDDFFHEMMGSEGNELGRETMQPLYDFIDAYGEENPMFIWYGPMLPHTPFDAPYKYSKYFEHKNISESARMYYSNIAWWDDGVGQLMDYLELKGMLEDTLFIYISDNGWEQDADVEYWKPGATYQTDTLFANGGEKGKGGLYEQSLRSTVLFYWKNQIQPSFNDQSLVSMLDLYPTILDVAGVSGTEALRGRSLKPQLMGHQIEERTQLITYSDNRRSKDHPMGKPHEGYALTTARWHFIWDKSDGVDKLFDRTVDPKANHDLSDQFPELVQRFKEDVLSWKEELGMEDRLVINQ